MLLTEKEATERWCPFARVVPGTLRDGVMYPGFYGTEAHNRVQLAQHEDEEATWHKAMHCLGSACMAWRWAEIEYDWMPKGKEDEWGKDGWVQVRKSKISDGGLVYAKRNPKAGFCGLAGKP